MIQIKKTWIFLAFIAWSESVVVVRNRIRGTMDLFTACAGQFKDKSQSEFNSAEINFKELIYQTGFYDPTTVTPGRAGYAYDKNNQKIIIRKASGGNPEEAIQLETGDLLRLVNLLIMAVNGVIDDAHPPLIKVHADMKYLIDVRRGSYTVNDDNYWFILRPVGKVGINGDLKQKAEAALSMTEEAKAAELEKLVKDKIYFLDSGASAKIKIAGAGAAALAGLFGGIGGGFVGIFTGAYEDAKYLGSQAASSVSPGFGINAGKIGAGFVGGLAGAVRGAATGIGTGAVAGAKMLGSGGASLAKSAAKYVTSRRPEERNEEELVKLLVSDDPNAHYSTVTTIKDRTGKEFWQRTTFTAGDGDTIFVTKTTVKTGLDPRASQS